MYLICESPLFIFRGEEFRQDFGRLQDLLSIFPGVPALVVTATASVPVRDKIIKSLSLQDPTLVTAHPDRQNISYSKRVRRPAQDKRDDLDEILLPIAGGLRQQKGDYPLTIFYGDLEDIAYVYRYLEAALGASQYVGLPLPENRLFGMYHQLYSATVKAHIVAELGKVNSKVRFVAATVALGMGLDAPAIRKVIHFKSPTSIERYLQETGRAGRDGKPAEAVLYYNNTDLRANRPGQQSAMVRYCRTTGQCLRQILMEYLGFGAPESRTKALCCDVCKMCNWIHIHKQTMLTGVILICALSNLNVEGREVLEKCHVVRRVLKVSVFQYFL